MKEAEDAIPRPFCYVSVFNADRLMLPSFPKPNQVIKHKPGIKQFHYSL